MKTTRLLGLASLGVLVLALPASAKDGVLYAPLGDFRGHAIPTLVQSWGLLMIPLAAVSFGTAWRLMGRRAG